MRFHQLGMLILAAGLGAACSGDAASGSLSVIDVTVEHTSGTEAGTWDSTEPEVEILAPRDGETVSGAVKVQIAASDDVAVTRVELEVNGAEAATLSEPPYEWIWETEDLPGGDYDLAAVAFDGDGKRGRAVVTVTLEHFCGAEDDCPPESVRIITPVAGATLCGTVTIEATASDDHGVARMQFLVDDLPLGTDGEAPYQAEWDTTAVADGQHRLKAVAFDALSQQAFAQQNVEVNNAGEQCDNVPSVVLLAPKKESYVTGEVTVEAKASDDEGVVSVQFFVDNGLLVEDTSVPYGTSWDTSDFDEGPHTLKAIARDTKGQISSEQIQVTLDNTPPGVRLLEPACGVLFEGNTMPVALEVQDNFEVERVELSFAGDVTVLTTPAWTAELNVGRYSGGWRELVVTAVDAAGLTDTDTCDLRFKQPPVVTFAKPYTGETVRGPIDVWVDAHDQHGLADVELFEDDALVGSFNEGSDGIWWIEWTPSYVAGPRELRAVATNLDGDTAEARLNVMVDHLVEAVLKVCAAGGGCEVVKSGTEVSGTVDFEVSARDDGPVGKLELLVQGNVVASATTTPMAYAWDTTTEPNGSVVEVMARATGQGGDVDEARATLQVNLCDRDQDGVPGEGEGCGGSDCDDNDPERSPALPDDVGDGVDNNCDGLDGVDADGDGHASVASGGNDCDDGDASVRPAGFCDDCDACTEDTFEGGQCVHEPLAESASCDDGDVCTEGETCVSGACGGGTAVECDDGNPCTADACEPVTGCMAVPRDNYLECPGGRCFSGMCVPIP